MKVTHCHTFNPERRVSADMNSQKTLFIYDHAAASKKGAFLEIVIVGGAFAE